MATKKQRQRAALLYAAAWLYRDDGVLASEFTEELKDIAEGMLRRIRWPGSRVPDAHDILKELEGTAKS